MIRVISYEPASGQLIRILQVPTLEQARLSSRGDCGLLEVGFDLSDDDLIRSYYVANGALVRRPEGTAKLDGLTLTGLPVGGVLHVSGERFDIVEDRAELEFSLPGTYRISVSKFPLETQTFEVTV